MLKQWRSLVVFKLAQRYFIENDLTKKQFIKFAKKEMDEIYKKRMFLLPYFVASLANYLFLALRCANIS
jgi:hypothetical protein